MGNDEEVNRAKAQWIGMVWTPKSVGLLPTQHSEEKNKNKISLSDFQTLGSHKHRLLRVLWPKLPEELWVRAE